MPLWQALGRQVLMVLHRLPGLDRLTHFPARSPATTTNWQTPYPACRGQPERHVGYYQAVGVMMTLRGVEAHRRRPFSA